MKKLIFVSFAACLLAATPSHAGFIMKKQPATITAVSQVSGKEDASSVENVPSTVISQDVVKEQSKLSQMLGKKSSSAEIPKVIYIVLAIIGFGWLGMGINDNFKDWDWVISLILSILFWLPGLIYSLVKMKKYYK